MRRAICIAWILVLAAVPATAGAKLLLSDGTVLEGASVERKDAFYLLRVEDEDGTEEVVAVPAQLVEQMRLSAGDDPAPTGLRAAKPQTLSGSEDTPDLPKTDEMLFIFGEPARSYARGVVDPRWRPRSDWDNGLYRNQFNPARWFKAPVDPTFIPKSAYRQSQDVTRFDPARWYSAPLDPVWRPRDGWRWFESILNSPGG